MAEPPTDWCIKLTSISGIAVFDRILHAQQLEFSLHFNLNLGSIVCHHNTALWFFHCLILKYGNTVSILFSVFFLPFARCKELCNASSMQALMFRGLKGFKRVPWKTTWVPWKRAHQSVKVKIPRGSSIKLCKFFKDQGVADVHLSKQNQIWIFKAHGMTLCQNWVA